MKNNEKTKDQLISKLAELRQKEADASHTQIINQRAALLDMSRAVQEVEKIDDLERVMGVLFEQMKTIGLTTLGLDFQRMIDAETRTFTVYSIRPNGTSDQGNSIH